MSVLDAIDTTVTCEWGETRTIGTLVRLGGREAVITALRAPTAGEQVFLRVEGETPEESVALDGTCSAVADSDWGEHEVTIEVLRVGSTVSAAVRPGTVETPVQELFVVTFAAAIPPARRRRKRAT